MRVALKCAADEGCGARVRQFCGVAIIETKNRAMAVVRKLEEQLDFPKPVRMHWTGCPNSCAQARTRTAECSFPARLALSVYTHCLDRRSEMCAKMGLYRSCRVYLPVCKHYHGFLNASAQACSL